MNCPICGNFEIRDDEDNYKLLIHLWSSHDEEDLAKVVVKLMKEKNN